VALSVIICFHTPVYIRLFVIQSLYFKEEILVVSDKLLKRNVPHFDQKEFSGVDRSID